MMKMEELTLTQDWDKTFPKSGKVDHCKVTFVNRYGITLAADMYSPKDAEGKLQQTKLAAIAVCGPFGAVKEQCSGLYAQTMAERGFLTVAFDPSFTGESGGNVRYMASPDINTEDFMAAVDFLSLCDKVDPERIGILAEIAGMCLVAMHHKHCGADLIGVFQDRLVQEGLAADDVPAAVGVERAYVIAALCLVIIIIVLYEIRRRRRS